MRRRLGRGRGGPGLLGTVARTAVIAGTASAVSGRVGAAQQAAAQQQQQAAAAQEQLRQMQLQAQIDAQVDARMAGTRRPHPRPRPRGPRSTSCTPSSPSSASCGRRACSPTPSSPSRRPGCSDDRCHRCGDARASAAGAAPPRRHRLPGRWQPHRLHRGRAEPAARRPRARAEVRGRRAQRHLRRRGVRAAGLDGAARRRPAHRPGPCSTGSGPTTPRPRPLDAAANAWLLWASTLQSTGLLPPVSPYDLPSTGLDQFRDAAHPPGRLRPRSSADPLGAQPAAARSAPSTCSPGSSAPSTAAASGSPPDMILASAAIPTLFPAVHIDGGTFWDGLFSQNPPVHELLDAAARRAVGDPDQPDGPRRRAAARCSTSPTGATSCPATSRSTRSCTASR